MLSKAKIKFIHSLEQKKYRREAKAFVAEGPKVVGDLMEVSSPLLLAATDEWLKANTSRIAGNGGAVSNLAKDRCSNLAGGSCDIYEVTQQELQGVSFLQHPQDVLAVFPIVDDSVPHDIDNMLSLALDNVQDPGNLGTIIRIADWFGISHIFCSQGTADAYNPKVIQATMGSIARVGIHYVDLKAFLSQQPATLPIYGTLLDGKDIYGEQLSANGIIVMGNEGNGISPAIQRLVSHRLLIPNYPKGRKTADSLNVAIATAIACSEFRRNMAVDGLE